MSRYQVTVKRSQAHVIEQTKKFFDGRIPLVDEAPCCLRFEGGGGFVQVTVTELDPKKTDVRVEEMQWEYDAKKLIQMLS
jgi:hypothetical protein